jgi:hypothetical protein
MDIEAILLSQMADLRKEGEDTIAQINEGEKELASRELKLRQHVRTMDSKYNTGDDAISKAWELRDESKHRLLLPDEHYLIAYEQRYRIAQDELEELHEKLESINNQLVDMCIIDLAAEH